MTNTQLKGRITAVVEDRHGNLRQKCTVENTITDAFLKSALVQSLSAGGVGTVLRALSKPATGQYAAGVVQGTFGIYALNKPITVDRGTVMPPYVTKDLLSLDPSVTFYNTDPAAAETLQIMVPVDYRSVYSRASDRNSFTVEYVKNTGAGTVQSLCVGRKHDSLQSCTGLLLGEALPDPNWIKGTVDYLLEHWVAGVPTELCPKGNQQGTTVWKQVSDSVQFSANLVTKQYTPYANAGLSANIKNVNLTGGHVFTAGNGRKVAVKALHGTNEVNIKRILLHYSTDLLNSTTTTRVVEIPVSETSNVNVPPVMVSRPDNGTLELWVSVSSGAFPGPDEEPVQGFHLVKAVMTDPADPEFSEITLTDMGIVPYGFGSYNTGVGIYGSGFYFADLKNADATDKAVENRDPVYYLPFTASMRQNGTILNYSTLAAPGITADAGFTGFRKMWLARTASAQEFNAPVMSDAGPVHCRVNSTTLYYAMLGGTVSGANFPSPIVKGENDILRLLYEYSLT